MTATAPKQVILEGALKMSRIKNDGGHAHLHHFGSKGIRVETLEEHQSADDQRKLFRRPRIHQYMKPDGTIVRSRHERRVSWNELFFDLIFVAIIAHLTHVVRADPALIGWYILMFASLWIVWRDFTIYINRFESNDLFHKLFFVAEMLGIVMAGVHMTPDVLYTDVGGTAFSGAMLSVHLLLIVMYARVFWYHPNVAWTLGMSLLSNGISVLLYFVTIFVTDQGARIGMWSGVLVACTFWPPLFVVYLRHCLTKEQMAHRRSVPYAIEHIAERFGLFTIVVLGEEITASLFDAKDANATMYLVSACTLVTAACLQWIYFDVEAGQQQAHAIRRHYATGFAWLLVHLPLAICLALAGGSIGQQLKLLAAHNSNSTEMTAEADRRRSADSAPGAAAMAEGVSETELLYIQLFESCGVGGTLICLALIGCLHDSMVSVVAWHWRVLVRFVVGVLLCCLPLMFNQTIFVSACCTAGSLGVLMFELIGARPLAESDPRNRKAAHGEEVADPSQPVSPRKRKESFKAVDGADLPSIEPDETPLPRRRPMSSRSIVLETSVTTYADADDVDDHFSCASGNNSDDNDDDDDDEEESSENVGSTQVRIKSVWNTKAAVEKASK